MTFIDNHIASESASHSSTAKPSALDNRQGWLKALESAGLRDALDNTRAFPGARDHIPNPETESDKTLSAPLVRHLESAKFARREVSAPPSIEPMLEAVQAPTSFRSPVDAESGLPANTCAAPQGQAAQAMDIGCGQQEIAPPAATGDATSHADKTWASRNLLLLPIEGGGVEIWVRDAKLSAARMQMLLSDLRRTATDFGSGPIKVFLNGRPVASADGRTRQGE